jgi:hypothetical protein
MRSTPLGSRRLRTVSYQLKIGRPLEKELRRITDAQLAAALHEIRTHPDGKRREAIRAARRHVKRVRALLRLAQRGFTARERRPTGTYTA